ncbi:MAG: 16S rRNA (adenine(1518)-N(6)/adenine(1519)-N(6))-dimethyltransferase RsmA [Campylobacterales bacterium]
MKSIPENNLPIVEIGAGLGDLTKRLIDVRDVISYEVDRELCAYLKESFADSISSGRLELVCGDVVESFAKGLSNKDYNLVANLPYYIATKIVLEAIKDSRCKTILVMVQKEVAQRFCAKPKDRNYSSLSILTELCGNSEILFDIAPENFNPPPNVNSSMLLIRKERSLNDREFEKFLRVAFSAPRKKLMSNLKPLGAMNKVSEFFKLNELAETLRPHELNASLYQSLFHTLKKGSKDGKYRKQ